MHALPPTLARAYRALGDQLRRLLAALAGLARRIYEDIAAAVGEAAAQAAHRVLNALLGERPPRRQSPRLSGITPVMPPINHSNNDDASWRHEFDAPGWYGPDLNSPATGDQDDEPIPTPTPTPT